MGWTNIYRRRMKVFTLAFVIYLDYKALQQREKWINKSKRAALWEKAHERNAKRVLSLIIELEGFWVKLGQYMSTRADVLPGAYIYLLKQLQDSLPPRPLEEVCGTIEKEFGQSMDDLFLNFDKEPLATASVCAYKDGEVIIDTSAGMLGRYDPRPVQPDSLFPVFSVTKGVTAGMLHWLVDNGKLTLEENIANVWPQFRSSGKDLMKVHHVLNHTSGLHNALANLSRENPLFLLDWDACLSSIAMSEPETEPGREQLYHYISFGWLCGGIIEHASGKKFQEVLEEALIRPLNIEGELYIGIPPGVESRLASLTTDTDDLKKLSELGNRSDLPSTFQPQDISRQATTPPALFNTLNVRRAIIPAANGHCSARALERYYATLVDGGKVPPPHSPSSKPPLGSHPHHPKFPTQKPKAPKQQKSRNWRELVMSTNCMDRPGRVPKPVNASENSNEGGLSAKPSSDYIKLDDGNGTGSGTPAPSGVSVDKIFENPKIHDAFLGVGDYEKLVHPNGTFGLGFKRCYAKDGTLVGFGHSGMGGSTGYCDIKNRFAIAVTLNKMSFGGVTGKIVQLVCSELGIPVLEEHSRSSQESVLERPVIN